MPEEIKPQPGFKLEDIARAYSGRQGCMCGCRGKYHETPGMIARLWKNALALLDGTHPNGGMLTEHVVDEHGYWENFDYETEGGSARTLCFYTAKEGSAS